MGHAARSPQKPLRTELVDTFQAFLNHFESFLSKRKNILKKFWKAVYAAQVLSQTCFDRLTDELGPLSRWVREESLLHVAPEQEIKPPASPTERLGTERKMKAFARQAEQRPPTEREPSPRLSTAPTASRAENRR